MPCGSRAVLIVTQSVQGTSTNIAQRRVELCCDAPLGHTGPHTDTRRGESWEAEPGKVATVLRHEDA